MQFFNDFINACKTVYYNFQYFCSLDLFGMLKYLLYNINTIFYVVVVCTIAYFLLRLFVFREKKIDVHGSASWGNYDDLKEANLIKNPGNNILLGKMKGEYVCAPYHAIICAKTRAGKGVGTIIPTLLTFKGSMIVNDVKGENFCITSRKREMMGQDVFCIDPYNTVCKEPHGFNPLSYIKEGDPDAVMYATQIANIIGVTFKTSDAFFNMCAEMVITCGILNICKNKTGNENNIMEVRKFLAQKDKAALLDAFLTDESYNGIVKMTASDLYMHINEKGDVNDTISGIFQTVSAMLLFLNDERIQKMLCQHDVKLDSFRYMPQTLYIVFSFKTLAISKVAMRLIYTFAMNLNASSDDVLEFEEQGMKRNQKLILCMDEFAQLGEFSVVKDAMPLVAGYGVNLMIIVQSINQLIEHFKEGSEDFLGNAMKLFIGCESTKTAEYISEFCGDTTVETYNKDQKGKTTTSYVARKLITVGECIQMNVLKPILLAGGVRPTRINRLTYHEDKDFKGQFDKFEEGK